MSFMFQPLHKYADFKGRARRAEFWQFALLVWGVEIVAMTVLAATGGENGGIPAMAVALVFALVMLGLLVPSVAVAVRRLHDTGMSGWWLFIGFVPLLGAAALFIFYVIDGTRGDNRFGPDPKALVGDSLLAA